MTSDQKNPIIGTDPASPQGDYGCTVTGEKLPDGTLRVTSVEFTPPNNTLPTPGDRAGEQQFRDLRPPGMTPWEVWREANRRRNADEWQPIDTDVALTGWKDAMDALARAEGERDDLKEQVRYARQQAYEALTQWADKPGGAQRAYERLGSITRMGSDDTAPTAHLAAGPGGGSDERKGETA